jgi:hypothetical protein
MVGGRCREACRVSFLACQQVPGLLDPVLRPPRSSRTALRALQVPAPLRFPHPVSGMNRLAVVKRGLTAPLAPSSLSGTDDPLHRRR